jgi:hypothetical protein
MKNMNKIAILGAVVATLVLSGCASKPKTLYRWDGYETSVYEYLKAPAGDSAAQLAKLETQEQKTLSKNVTSPPGFDAHMGLLYTDLGQYDQAKVRFMNEKNKYPESVAYMDFLLNNMGHSPKPTKKTK